MALCHFGPSEKARSDWSVAENNDVFRSRKDDHNYKIKRLL